MCACVRAWWQVRSLLSLAEVAVEDDVATTVDRILETAVKLVNADRVTFFVVDAVDGSSLIVQATLGRQSALARHNRVRALKIPINSSSIVGDVALVRVTKG